MVEILIAASIIVAVVLAAMAVTQKSLLLSRQSVHTAQASFILEEGAEAMRIIRDNEWNNISSLSNVTNYYLDFSGNTWTLTQTASQTGIFTRTVNIASVSRDGSSGDINSSGSDDPGTKLITVSVSWTEGGQSIIKTLSFYLSDIFS